MQYFERVAKGAAAFNDTLLKQKAEISDIPWYPYGTLNNFAHLEPLITPEIDELFSGGRKIADIGAADGELAFYMETFDNSCDVYDYGPTNYNTLRGARALKEARKSSVSIVEVDLDSYFEVSTKYDLIFFLGLLYHLKNPYYVLEKLASVSKYMFLSTRIARHLRIGAPDSSDFAAAYLLTADESNNDATNFWVFTDAGLKRILKRTGWEVVAYRTVGDTSASNPQDSNHDERAFCILRSRHF